MDDLVRQILVWASCIGGALCVVYVVFHRRLVNSSNTGSDQRLPPGSMGWPLLGHTLEFLRKNPAQELEYFLKKGRSRYGNVFQANLFGLRTIVSMDPELNKFVIHNEGKLFRSNWPQSLRKLFGEHSMPVVTGDEHRVSRGLLLDFLGLGKSNMGKLLPHIEAAALETMRSWKDNSVLHFHEEAKSFSFAVLCKIGIGNLIDREAEHIRKLYSAFEAGLLSLPIKFPGTAYSKGLQARAQLDEFFQKIMDARRQQPQNCHDDLLDFVLTEGKNLTDTAIHDFLVTTIYAGHDTTASLIASVAIFLKSNPPNTLQALVKEHNDIRQSKTGGEGLSMDDYAKMFFTQDVISEALRLVNISIGSFRVALEDVEMKDYHIPKGCAVYVSFTSNHFDPETFSNPCKFDPCRWQTLNTSATTRFTPFGGGSRHCPGYELARLEASVFLHHFLTKYQWEPTEPDVLLHIPTLITAKNVPVRIKSKCRDYA